MCLVESFLHIFVLLDVGQDGSMTCNKCKQKFKRERHFKSHKCKGIEGDLYVKPEDIPELEDGFDSRIKYPIKEPRRSADVAKVVSEENVDHDETEVAASILYFYCRVLAYLTITVSQGYFILSGLQT